MHTNQESVQGLKFAEKFLSSRGYRIVERGFECDAGTIDLVAENDDALAFVEVQFRDRASEGFPSESASQIDRERLERTALAFLQGYNEDGVRPVRFDVVSVVALSEDRAFIRHHISVYEAA